MCSPVKPLTFFECMMPARPPAAAVPANPARPASVFETSEREYTKKFIHYASVSVDFGTKYGKNSD